MNENDNIKIGLYDRLRKVFGPDFKKVKPKDHKLHGIEGVLPCDSSDIPMCLEPGFVYLGGESYCAAHAVKIVERYEKDEKDSLEYLHDGLIAIGLKNIEPEPGKECRGLGERCFSQPVVKAVFNYCLFHGEIVLKRHHNAIETLTK